MFTIKVVNRKLISKSNIILRSYASNKNPISRTWNVIKKDIPVLFGKERDILYPEHADIVIIGGGVIGASVAYWLKTRAGEGLSVVVIEKDFTYKGYQKLGQYTQGNLKQHYSLPENLHLAQNSSEFLRNINKNLGSDVAIDYHPTGSLVLASEKYAEKLEYNVKLQNEFGFKNKLLSPETLRNQFPWINTDDIKLDNITLDLQEYNDSLPNISTGFFDKHYPLEDEIMNNIMHDLGIEVLNKNKFPADQIMPIPSTSTPTLTHPRSQSEVIHPDGTDDDNIERMSITPTPSVYNSFASSPSSPAHDLLEPNQTHQSVNSGNNAITSVVNCQSPKITTTDASSAAEASSECSTASIINGRKRLQFSIDRSKRKRLRNKDKWIDTKRKLLLNSGKQHLSRKGKMQLAKCIKAPCDVCKFKCCLKISPQERKNIFDRFWGLADHEKQWVFIGKYTKRYTKKRITTENYLKRNFSVTYTLPVGLDKSSPRSVKVCKTMFKNTLSISNQFILSALDKYDKNTGNSSKDLRGHHDSKNKITTGCNRRCL